jgi:hypothetical protein
VGKKEALIGEGLNGTYAPQRGTPINLKSALDTVRSQPIIIQHAYVTHQGSDITLFL